MSGSRKPVVSGSVLCVYRVLLGRQGTRGSEGRQVLQDPRWGTRPMGGISITAVHGSATNIWQNWHPSFYFLEGWRWQSWLWLSWIERVHGMVWSAAESCFVCSFRSILSVCSIRAILYLCRIRAILSVVLEPPRCSIRAILATLQGPYCFQYLLCAFVVTPYSVLCYRSEEHTSELQSR